MPRELTDQQRADISSALFAGQKIQAIKLYRDAAQCGLAEAKEFIDRLDPALRKEHPDQFQHPATGCGASAAILLLGTVILCWRTGWL